MIKAKVISLITAGAVTIGVGGAITISKWSEQKDLTKTTSNISTYIDNTNTSMQRAEQIIKEKNLEISNLENDTQQYKDSIKKDKSTISNLQNKNQEQQKQIQTLNNELQNSSGQINWQDAYTCKKQVRVLNRILKSWGYGPMGRHIMDETLISLNYPYYQGLYATVTAVKKQQQVKVDEAKKSTSTIADSSKKKNDSKNEKKIIASSNTTSLQK